MLQAAAFYILAATAVISAFMVVAARNPVRAVLFLILTFFSAAGLFVMLGAEFLAMLLVIVYVGAVAVLFLFVVMMLDVDFCRAQRGLPQLSAAWRRGGAGAGGHPVADGRDLGGVRHRRRCAAIARAGGHGQCRGARGHSL